MDFGFGELLLLALVGVLFLGPTELARIAYKFGAWTRKVRRMSQEFMYELTREADIEDAREEVRKIEAMIKAPLELTDDSLKDYHPPEAPPTDTAPAEAAHAEAAAAFDQKQH